MSSALQRVRDVVEPLVNSRGFDLEDVSVQPGGRRRLIQILVDRAGGVSLDDVAELSRDLSAALDDADVFGDQPYVLDVGSPGVERPLSLPRHWSRNVGRLVRVIATDGHEVLGRIMTAGDSEATLAVDGADVVVAFADVRSAVVQVELNRIADPADEEA